MVSGVCWPGTAATAASISSGESSEGAHYLPSISSSKQFAHFALGRRQRFPAQRRGAIYFPQRFAVALFGGAQVALLFQTVQQRIKLPGLIR